MVNTIYTERRLGKYKNKITDHIREVYGPDCWLKRDEYIINNKRKYIPLYIQEDKICGLIEIDIDGVILCTFLQDGSTDFRYTSTKIKFI